MDQHVEDAFRLNIKWSLQEISKAINGDGKSSPNPLFRIKVVLQAGKHGAQEVGFKSIAFKNIISKNVVNDRFYRIWFSLSALEIFSPPP